jgi:lipoic acid synthetase
VGAELVATDRGGDVTYHGPGQLVGYPILTVPGKRGGSGMADTVAYVRSVEQLVIDALADLGLDAGRQDRYPGVWVGDRKICAIGVRLTRGRSMHGFALNVDPDLSMFGHIVPCGIADKEVTSLRAEGLDVTMAQVVDAVAARAAERWGTAGWDRDDVLVSESARRG